MARKLRNGAMIVAVLSMLILPGTASAQQRDAMVRVAHLSTDVPSVDVYVDGEAAGVLSGISFGTVSPYLPLPAGTRHFEVYAAGDLSAPLLSADLTFGSGESQTLSIVGLMRDGSLEARVYADDDSSPEGVAKVRAVQAVPDIGAATVTTPDGEPLLALPGFSSASEYAEVPVGVFTLQLRPAGTDQAVLTAPGIILAQGRTYTAFIIGSATEGTLDLVLVQDGGGATGGQPLADTGGPFSPLGAYLILQFLGLGTALFFLALWHGLYRPCQLVCTLRSWFRNP